MVVFLDIERSVKNNREGTDLVGNEKVPKAMYQSNAERQTDRFNLGNNLAIPLVDTLDSVLNLDLEYQKITIIHISRLSRWGGGEKI